MEKIVNNNIVRQDGNDSTRFMSQTSQTALSKLTVLKRIVQWPTVVTSCHSSSTSVLFDREV